MQAFAVMGAASGCQKVCQHFCQIGLGRSRKQAHEAVGLVNASSGESMLYSGHSKSHRNLAANVYWFDWQQGTNKSKTAFANNYNIGKFD